MAEAFGIAKRLAEDVMKDLRGRKGVLDDIEPSVQRDIERELGEMIQDRIDKWIVGDKS